MSLLSYNELVELVESGVIEGVSPEQINAASIDIRLGSEVMAEVDICQNVVDIHKREVFSYNKINITKGGYFLKPNEFILAHTKEVFNLPNNICAEFKLKSSSARTGLDNALATWCDCGWSGSVLTLELKNLLRYHTLKITENQFIGQMIFYRVKEVPDDRSYSVRGRYNGDLSVQNVKI